MGLGSLEAKIIEEAEKEARRIKKEAQKQVEELTAKAGQKAELEYSAIIKSAHQKAAALKKSILVPARLEAKKTILSAKHEILDQVFHGLESKKTEENIEKIAAFLFTPKIT